MRVRRSARTSSETSMRKEETDMGPPKWRAPFRRSSAAGNGEEGRPDVTNGDHRGHLLSQRVLTVRSCHTGPAGREPVSGPRPRGSEGARRGGVRVAGGALPAAPEEDAAGGQDEDAHAADDAVER